MKQCAIQLYGLNESIDAKNLQGYSRSKRSTTLTDIKTLSGPVPNSSLKTFYTKFWSYMLLGRWVNAGPAAHFCPEGPPKQVNLFMLPWKGVSVIILCCVPKLLTSIECQCRNLRQLCCI